LRAAAGRTIDAIFFVGGRRCPPWSIWRRRRPWAAAVGRRSLDATQHVPVPHRRRHPENSYGSNSAAVTVGIGTYWLVLRVGRQLVHDITAALWHPATASS